MSDSATLTDAATRLEVRGGTHLTIASLTHDGHELLVAPDELPEDWRVHGERAGVTFLHPWANRAAGAPWDDLDGLPRDPAGIAIHGYPGTWAVREDGPRRIVAETEHEPTAAFPYAHRVEVAIELAAAGVVVDTVLVATGDRDVPAVFGWHPYFRAPAGATLAAPARRHLVLDDRLLPTGAGDDEEAEELTLGAATLDEAYEAIAPGATWTTSTIAVRFDEGYPGAQVFAPATRPSLSIEPMAAPTGALASGSPAAARPGAPYRARFTLLLGRS